MAGRKSGAFDEKNFHAQQNEADENNNYCQNYRFHALIVDWHCKYSEIASFFFGVSIIFCNLGLESE